MPLYVYKCKNELCGNMQEEKHSIAECDSIEIQCVECGEVMARVPQPFRWGRSSWDVLAEKMDKKYREYKTKVAQRKKFGTYQKKAPYKDYENIGGETIEMKR